MGGGVQQDERDAICLRIICLVPSEIACCEAVVTPLGDKTSLFSFDHLPRPPFLTVACLSTSLFVVVVAIALWKGEEEEQEETRSRRIRTKRGSTSAFHTKTFAVGDKNIDDDDDDDDGDACLVAALSALTMGC